MSLTTEQLAIRGGPPVHQGPWVPGFHGSEEFAEEEKEAVLRVLEKKRVFRPSGPGDLRGFLDSRLTPDAAYHVWVGPRDPPRENDRFKCIPQNQRNEAHSQDACQQSHRSPPVDLRTAACPTI